MKAAFNAEGVISHDRTDDDQKNAGPGLGGAGGADGPLHTICFRRGVEPAAVFHAAGGPAGGKNQGMAGCGGLDKAKNKLRHLGRELPLEEDILKLLGQESPEAELTRTERCFLVNWAVNDLLDQDREIFLRHYYHAQTVREIAEKMSLNESTIKTRLRRGRMKLKEILTRWGAI